MKDNGAVCKHCGTVFGNNKSLDMHERQIHPETRYEKAECPMCGDEFKQSKNTGKPKTCSKECGKEMVSKKIEGRKLSEKTKRKLSEANKGREVSDKRKEEISKRMKKNNPMHRKEIREKVSGDNHYRYGEELPERVKQKLSKILTGRKMPEDAIRTGEDHHMYGVTGEDNHRYGSKHSEETLKIMSGQKMKDKNPMWEGGKTYRKYGRGFNEELRERIRKRDNHQCSFCGISQEKHIALFDKKLSIHHCDRDKKNNSISNLLSLCIYCHRNYEASLKRTVN